MARSTRQTSRKKQTPEKNLQADESQQDENQDLAAEQAESQGENRQSSEVTPPADHVDISFKVTPDLCVSRAELRIVCALASRTHSRRRMMPLRNLLAKRHT